MTMYTDQRNATGGMFINMGFLWLVGVPILVVAITMVRIECITYMCWNEDSYSKTNMYC